MGTFSIVLVVYSLIGGSPGASSPATVTIIDNFQTYASCLDGVNQLKQIHSAAGNADGSLRSQAYCFNHY